MSAPEPINSKHILVLTKWYPNRLDPQLGIFIQKHLRAIAQFHRVTVFYSCADPNKETDEMEFESYQQDNLSAYIIYYKPSQGLFSATKGGLKYYQSWLLFKKKTGIFNDKNSRPDVLHAYILLRTALIAWIESKRYGIPFFISEQWSGFITGKALQKPFYWRAMSKWIISKASGVSAVSNFLKTKLEIFSGRKDIQVFYNTIEKTDASEDELQQESINILIVADLVDEIKNISGVIHVFSKVVKDFPKIKLHIVGGGKDHSILASLADKKGLLNKSIYFEGRKTNQEVYSFIRQSDFLIMNSRFETFSLICAEALICGKPVIATACGGPQEFITAACGLLIPPDDENALEVALRKMVVDFRNYDRKSLSDYATKHFSPEGVGRRFAEWLGK